MNVKIKKLNPDAIIPTYGTNGAACFDIYALNDTAVVEGSFAIVNTGLAFEIPEGYVMKVYSRSGHGFKNAIRLANCVGIIDSDYRGELMIKLQSDRIPPAKDDNVYHGQVLFGNNDHLSPKFIVKKGDRIAQAMVEKYEKTTFELVEGELGDTERGTGGLGSTGK